MADASSVVGKTIVLGILTNHSDGGNGR